MALYNDVIRIEGGQVPSGKVVVSGAKNSATRLLAAASLCDEPVYLTGYPVNLVDSKHKERFLSQNGVQITTESDSSLRIDAKEYNPRELNSYFYPIRTTYLLVAGQLKRNRQAFIPYPGGCNIGARKYDLHIMVWESFGCKVIEKEEHIFVESPKELVGSKVTFPISTVGGTENALLMAAIAKGTTTIENAYVTPEIEDLITFLQRCGVSIEVEGQSFIKVVGAKKLKGHTFHVIPDRIEALTWLIYGAISKGNILIENVPLEAMEIPLMYLKSAGLDFFQNSNSIYISPHCLSNGAVHSFEVACGTHPGIISDMQPFYVMLGLIAIGRSRVHDYRYPERVTYVRELQKFVDQEITFEKGKISTNGPVQFNSANAVATDLRGTMAAILAALCAPEGVSEITGVSMALRGYNDLVIKLKSLGVEVIYETENTEL